MISTGIPRLLTPATGWMGERRTRTWHNACHIHRATRECLTDRSRKPPGMAR